MLEKSRLKDFNRGFEDELSFMMKNGNLNKKYYFCFFKKQYNIYKI